MPASVSGSLFLHCQNAYHSMIAIGHPLRAEVSIGRDRWSIRFCGWINAMLFSFPESFNPRCLYAHLGELFEYTIGTELRAEVEPSSLRLCIEAPW